MPHLIIEYSSNLSAFPSAEILPALNKSLTASTEIKDETDLKTRVIAVDDFRIGNQAGGRASCTPSWPSALRWCCAKACRGQPDWTCS